MPPDPAAALAALVADELAQPVDARVAALAAAVAARHPGALGVLFYGSCLWADPAALDGAMLDFYLIVADYRAAYARRWLAAANAALPPNVFPFAADGLVAKYAVLSLDHLRRETGPAARDASTYARLAQPTRLAWTASPAATAAIVDAVAQAAPTLLMFAAPTVDEADRGDPLALWRAAFARTYATELRAERGGRGDAIVAAAPDRYRAFAAAAVAADPALTAPVSPERRAIARASWQSLARRGRRRQLARLAKASATFAGGLDYLAWKINRHAGAGIAIRPWQRRWPVLGALSLLPRLLARGQVR